MQLSVEFIQYGKRQGTFSPCLFQFLVPDPLPDLKSEETGCESQCKKTKQKPVPIFLLDGTDLIVPFVYFFSSDGF